MRIWMGFIIYCLKAIFEIKSRYPDAYAIVLEYRSWLVEEVYQLLLVAHANASKVDAEMFLFVMDGAVVELLGGNEVGKGRLLGRLLVGWIRGMRKLL